MNLSNWNIKRGANRAFVVFAAIWFGSHTYFAWWDGHVRLESALERLGYEVKTAGLERDTTLPDGQVGRLWLYVQPSNNDRAPVTAAAGDGLRITPDEFMREIAKREAAVVRISDARAAALRAQNEPFLPPGYRWPYLVPPLLYLFAIACVWILRGFARAS